MRDDVPTRVPLLLRIGAFELFVVAACWFGAALFTIAAAFSPRERMAASFAILPAGMGLECFRWGMALRRGERAAAEAALLLWAFSLVLSMVVIALGAPQGTVLTVPPLLLTTPAAAGCVLHWGELRDPPAPEPRCSGCGYLLRGLRSRRCPECGATVDDPEDGGTQRAGAPAPRGGGQRGYAHARATTCHGSEHRTS